MRKVLIEKVDKDIAKSVVAQRSKAKASTTSPSKNLTTKGLLIKKPSSTSESKIKKDESQSSKGLVPNSKTARSTKRFSVFVKGPGPISKASTSKEKGNVLMREVRQQILKTQEVLRGRVFDLEFAGILGIVELLGMVKFQS